MKKIAIIGGGISGLYFANLLQKNKNYQYKVFEKKSHFELNDGYGIQLSVNSIKLLNEIGFKNIEAHEISFPNKVNFYDAKSCKKICDINISKFNYENNRYTTLKRSTLLNFLLKNIPENNIVKSCELNSINYKDKISLSFSNNHVEQFDYLLVSDGVFSKSKSIIFQKEISPKYYDSVALRGSIKDFESPDISLYLGSKFHFVIYPVNQNKEFNFISIIRKSLKKEQIVDKNYFNNYKFLHCLVNEISSKTSFNLRDKIKNIKSFPIFISDKFIKPEKRNIFFVGDALYAFPPSFAQGASQSIEASKEAYEEIENNTYSYYQKRYKKIKTINSRSIINYFTFHLSNSLTTSIRNLALKYLTKNKRFLENYLGKIYKN
jgi:salicylate hydroxylase